MELSEENELKLITDAFTNGVVSFRKRQYKEALSVFEKIIEDHKDSDHYSISEVVTRSMVYKNICWNQLNPSKIELHDEIDYLNDGIFNLNAGHLDTAHERFTYLLEKKYEDPYLLYLLSILSLKQNNLASCLDYLHDAVGKDKSLKITAHNEPDFDKLADIPEFTSLLEL